MTQIATQAPGSLVSVTQGRMDTKDIIAHVSAVQEVMRAVMKPNVHYGTIPGTDKNTLLKPGAEMLCMVFRIADTYQIEDMSADGVVRYRVTCIGTHQLSGVILGTGMGEASSAEEKYKWRKAYDDEYEATPENLRRVKMGKYKTKQVRTEQADLANTVLKMANKRAKVAMVLNVTAASDMFAQDLEDMDEALRDHLTRHPEQEQEAAQPAGKPALAPWPDADFEKRLPGWAKAIKDGKTPEGVIQFAETKGTLSDAQKQRIRDLAKPADDGVTDVQPKVTFAQVADKLNKAQSLEALAEAASLIAAVKEDQRAELSAMYDKRAEEMQ